MGAPAARSVHAEHERLDALLGFFVREAIGLHERSEIRIETRKRLGAGPLVLHDAEEVDHLVAQARKVACGLRCDLAGHAAKPFLDKLLERPACAVTREHRQIVQMDVGAAMRLGDFAIVDFGEPVIGRDRTRIGQDQPADGIGDSGVFLHTPVFDVDVAVDDGLVVEQRGVRVAHLFALLPIQNVGLGNIGVPGR